ncbi:Cloroperoxidase [Periconia macrospinosa]|uniref:Cloroperoxidase n=1 Tax=Periconia macrospinosa TaxID=97972 RepID=A0A2V1DD47_9PLEO|nr:Cloroperoxidase [Periconia macrospinosa]
MLFFKILPIVWISSVASASRHYPHWTPPSTGDVRSPCPLLNSLANHNIIPHNGKNLTVPMLVKALNETVNLSPEIATFTATSALSLAPDPSLGHFQLNDLDKHNAIEHDASLSRVDFHFVGKEGVAKFNYPTFKRWFAHFGGQEFIDIETAAKARFAMVQHSRDTNPEFTYAEVQRLASYVETTLYFKAMVDKWGRTRKEFVRVLFEQERLPFAEGWRRPRDQFDGFVQTDTVLRLALATPEKTGWSGESVQQKLRESSIRHSAAPAFNAQGPLIGS